MKISLDRHLKEKHYHGNKNLDYIEDMDSIGDIRCEHCEKQVCVPFSKAF